MKIAQFKKKILIYYDKNRRKLPWRTTTNPYHILISEIMLQQTQVDRVVDYYTKWVKKWPKVEDLAHASRKEVLREWIGLGYNSRAVNLHKAAQKISVDYNRDVIKAVQDYNNIPGVGPYTSAAVQIFSQNSDIVTVDTNIRRILIHEFGLSDKISDKELWEIAEKCLPKGKSKEWHNALMDYGAMLLTSRKTGIKPKTRQSKFQGSDREIRAKVLKLLLDKDVRIESIGNILNENKSRIKRILHKMKKEDLVIEKKGKVSLVN